MFNYFISKVESKNVKVDLDHADWVKAMKDKLNEFDRKKILEINSYFERCICCWSQVVFRNNLDK